VKFNNGNGALLCNRCQVIPDVVSAAKLLFNTGS
jgi:hypothetical protein